MSGACYPDRLINSIPNLYYYAANNPSEATIAKRRSYAATISYLTPPAENAGLYKVRVEVDLYVQGALCGDGARVSFVDRREGSISLSWSVFGTLCLGSSCFRVCACVFVCVFFFLFTKATEQTLGLHIVCSDGLCSYY